MLVRKGQRAQPVRFDDVNKIYPTRVGEVHAVQDVSLDLQAGEFVSVVGPSGCGKSTLLLMLAGLVPSTSGSISIGERRVDRPDTNLGIVFQDHVLLDWRTVLNNVLLQAEMRGLDKRGMRERALDLVRRVGLAGFEDRYPYELSGGMKQRVSICRALLHDPGLLLMDEPFGALDALTRDQLNLDLQDIWLQSRPTVMFITHSISEAVFLADRVVVMSARPGRVQTVIDIDIPRPRMLVERESERFGAYAVAIRRIFTSIGVLKDEASKPLAEAMHP